MNREICCNYRLGSFAISPRLDSDQDSTFWIPEPQVHVDPRELEKIFGEALVPDLPDFEFDKPRSRLVLRSAAGWKAIDLDVVPRDGGMRSLAMRACIRLDRVASEFLPYFPGLKPSQRRKHYPLISVHCTNLLDDEYLYSFEPTEDQIQEVARHFLLGIQQTVLPFLDEFFDEEAIASSLLNPDPAKRVTSDPLSRYCYLVSYFSLRSDWEQFDRLAEEWLVFCRSPPGTPYREIAEAVVSGIRQNHSH